MAVYTILDESAISTILQGYDVGRMRHFEPVSSGIENTNYFVWTESEKRAVSEWVLTIFENLSEQSLPFFNNLTCHLSKKGFAVPAPQIMPSGEFIFTINESGNKKNGVLVPKFEGASIDSPSIVHCRNIALFTAKMHVAVNDFEGVQSMPHSFVWCENLVEMLRALISKSDAQLLEQALERFRNYETMIAKCSQGVVHGDLFKDNVLFKDNEISGVIDFYNAGNTAFLFDLAVIANDWCVNAEEYAMVKSENQNVYDEQKLSALLSAYESIKPFSKLEREAWPRLLELAAFRFWLSRLKTKYLQGYQQDAKTGEVIKSPDAMKVILLAAMAR